MVVGVVVCGAVFAFERAGKSCDMTVTNYWAGFSMYASYFVLFALFAVGKYIFPEKTAKKDKKAGGAGAAGAKGLADAVAPAPAEAAAAKKGGKGA